MLTLYSLKPFKAELKGLVRDNRIAWACEEVGQPYKVIVLDPLKKEHKTAEYLKIHPMGKVPAIEDGGFVLFESSAICTYLGEKNRKLVPSPGTKDRALYDQWMAFVLTQIEAQSTRVFAADKFWEPNELTSKMRAQAIEFLEPALDVLNSVLSQRTNLVKDFSMVDLMLSMVLRYLSATELVQKRRALSDYLSRNYERPAYAQGLKKIEAAQG